MRYINFEGYVQATLVDSDPELLTGTTTVPVVSGMAVFDDLAVTEAGTARITFTAYRSTGEQYGTVTSEPFAVEDTEAPVITSTYLSYPYFGFVEVPANLAQNVEMAPDDVIQVTDNSGDESTLDISFSSSSGTPTCSSLIIFSDVRSCLAEAITNEVYATYTATDPSSNQAIAPTITFYSSRPTPSATFSTVTLSPSQASTDQGVINASVLEGGLLTLTAPAGTTFTAVLFASYGTPTGNTLGGCHAADSVSIVSAAFLVILAEAPIKILMYLYSTRGP